MPRPAIPEALQSRLDFHLRFHRIKGAAPVNAEPVIHLLLRGIGQARLADSDQSRVREGQAGGDQAVGARQAADGSPVPHVPALLQCMTDPF